MIDHSGAEGTQRLHTKISHLYVYIYISIYMCSSHIAKYGSTG